MNASQHNATRGFAAWCAAIVIVADHSSIERAYALSLGLGLFAVCFYLGALFLKERQ
jgi:hypothetical protein